MFTEASQLLLPFIVLAVVLALFIAAALFSRNYLKVSPNTVAVLSGRKRKLPDGRIVGYRMVRGGAALRIPLLEKVDYLSLNVMTIPLEIKRAYTVKGVPVSVKAVANVKIRSDDTSLHAAAERFLGMTHDQMQRVIFQTLEGHLRSILGTLTVEEINSDRAELRPEADQRSRRRPGKDGPRRGRAHHPGNQRRGRLPRRARQAPHGGSEARRHHRRGRGDARREDQVVAGLQEGEQAKLDADAEIAQAQRDFQIRQAQYQAEVETQKARAAQAGPLSRRRRSRRWWPKR